jgi:hypothetical protein
MDASGQRLKWKCGWALAVLVAGSAWAIPLPPVLLAPGSNALNVGISPVLKATVADPGNGNLKVTYSGRVAPANLGPDFTLVALPDTQYYSATKYGGQPAMFYAQTDWIRTNRLGRNIVYVAHLGDVVDHGDNNAGPNNTTEWRNATNALYRLEQTDALHPYGTPYGMAVGNHDQSPNGDATGTTTYFNRYFGVSHFSGRAYYGGHYATDNDNHFDLFSASGLNFVVVFLGYDTNATPAVLDWANGVLQTYTDRRAIVVSHYLIGNGDQSSFRTQGAAIYTALRTNANLFLMLCGHVGDNGEGTRVDNYNGHLVTTLLSDYQSRTNGGNGLMRLLEFSPSNNVIRVSTYSPWTGQYETDSDSQFTLSYNMQPSSAPFVPFGTNSNVASGTTSAAVWPSLQPNTTYEWYVKVTDAANNSLLGPTWRFTTGVNNSPPVATNQDFTVAGDVSTPLVLLASDPNADPLALQLDTLPAHGLVLGLEAASGALTYTPAHGFSGTDSFTFHANDGQSDSPVATATLHVQAPADSNANGLPDYWETYYGVSQPDADPDGDGLSNLQEYLANTNPTNAASGLRILRSSLTSEGHFVVTWSSVGGTRYRVQYRDGDFRGAFTDIQRSAAEEMDPAPPGTPATQNFVDPSPMTNGARFYRVAIVR